MKYVIIALFVGLLLACNSIQIVPRQGLPTSIPLENGQNEQNAQQPPPAEPAAQEAPTATPAPPPTPTLAPTPAPTPTPTPTPFFLQRFSLAGGSTDPGDPPRHGLLIAFVLPVLLFGVPWVILEFFVIRYVQPRGIDLAKVRIKAQDGLFIEAIMSMTARRLLTLASTRMTWSRARDFVEKSVEQELIHEAAGFPTLDDLERNLKHISENFMELPVVKELSRDFGVQIIRFNIEISYPPDTTEALQRRADASAGGTAYLAFAAAAHLDPATKECRELYRVYQENASQVDAARNLGGGVTSLVAALNDTRRRELIGETNPDTDE